MVGGGMSIGGLCLSVDCESISLRWIVKACRSVDCEGMIRDLLYKQVSRRGETSQVVEKCHARWRKVHAEACRSVNHKGMSVCGERF
jgi:hypothetical protein